MNKKKFIPILLIFIVLAFSILGYIVQKNEGNSQPATGTIGKMTTKTVSNIDTTDILLRIDGKKDYFLLKDLNYPLAELFNNLNNKTYSNIEIYPSYKEFFNLSDNYFKDNYGKYDNLDYDIIKIVKDGGIYHFDLRYFDEKADKIHSTTFSTTGRYFIDEPFLRVDDIEEVTEDDNYKIEVKSKAVFNKYEVYKVIIENMSDETLSIQSDMYGFYAKDSLNRYYHKIIGTNFGYDVRPSEIREFNIRLDTLSFDELFVAIDGKDIKIK